KDVTIADTIPAYTSFLSADNDGKEGNGVVKWTKKVKSGDSLTVTFKVKVNNNVNGQRIDNVADVKAGKNQYTTNE
uniref:DUF11 domain-containing protein n=1 Tax=Streptococcus constellatus TaxID=76860 RepID=UPI00066E09CB